MATNKTKTEKRQRKRKHKLGMVVHTCTPDPWEAEAGGSGYSRSVQTTGDPIAKYKTKQNKYPDKNKQKKNIESKIC